MVAAAAAGVGSLALVLLASRKHRSNALLVKPVVAHQLEQNQKRVAAALVVMAGTVNSGVAAESDFLAPDGSRGLESLCLCFLLIRFNHKHAIKNCLIHSKLPPINIHPFNPIKI
jgi:hypothetical protein